MKQLLLAATLTASFLTAAAQNSSYMRPPKVIEEMALATFSAKVELNSSNEWSFTLHEAPYYSVTELAKPELKLAGQRIQPQSYSPSRTKGYESITLRHLKSGQEIPVTGMPEGTILSAEWFPHQEKVLIGMKCDDGVYLYTASTTDAEMKRLTPTRVNAVTGLSIQWLSDDSFFFAAVSDQLGKAPQANPVPQGPIVQENMGKTTAARTYQDLLKNPYDEALFSYYFTSQLTLYTPSGEKKIGEPAIYKSINLSPDKSTLLVSVIEKPYSYTVPMYDFPTRTYLTNLEGAEQKELARTPVVVRAMGYDTTSPYPRNYSWRADKPCTLTWIEPLDGGQPKKSKSEFADALYQWEAPFTGEKQELLKTKHRLGYVQWCDDQFAVYSEMSQATRTRWSYIFTPARPEKEATLLFQNSMNDRYNDPGSVVLTKNAYDKRIIYTDAKHSFLLLTNQGASPQGDRPFISRYTLKSGKNDILWRSEAPYYETIEKVIDPAKLLLLTARQSKTEPINYYLRNLKAKKSTALTHIENPYKAMEGVTKQLIKYKRADGIDLTATVYLPAGYDKAKDGPLPVLMWAYPREYKSVKDAAQVRGSEYIFPVINYRSPVFWVTRGYCIMENVEMPIVGSEGKEPNDTYIEQLVMDAEAAVKAIADMGVGDPNRVAVGGHSYGGFMTGNLLTHTKLFKAGIARSGAYNRTLTPFGFQSETRTYWEAPEVYNAMSPFCYANQLSGALLLIHGEHDNNTGTFPIQSERFYQALKGHGATVRYVVLPLESHSYSAKENILHLMYEEDAWLEKYVKNAH